MRRPLHEFPRIQTSLVWSAPARQAHRHCSRWTANRPGSKRMARHKITGFLQSASAGRHAADGDRPRSAPCRTANRPGSQRMARYKITEFLQSATAGRHAADGDRPRSGGSFEMRPQFPAVALYKKWSRALSFSSESNPSSGCVILGIVELDQVMKKFILRSAAILLVSI